MGLGCWGKRWQGWGWHWVKQDGVRSSGNGWVMKQKERRQGWNMEQVG